MVDQPAQNERPPEGVKLTPAQEKSRRARNIAIGLTVGFFVVLFYAITVVKVGPAVFNRPL
jgi:hypothetical protein